MKRGRDKLFRYEIVLPHIVELVKQMVIEHKSNFKKIDINCILNVSNEKVYALGDNNKIIRAFENVIFYCEKYSKESKLMDISLSKNEFNVILEFTSYDQIVPPIEVPYIFRKFYKDNNFKDNETDSSGLELAITKNIIDLHNAKIAVESDALKTNFKIELPCIMD